MDISKSIKPVTSVLWIFFIIGVVFLLVILIILFIPFITYFNIKLKIYRYTFFIPPYDKLYKEKCKWVSENIVRSAAWIVDMDRIDDYENEYDPYPKGWSVRFIRKTDAMAYKLRWTN